jgi:hypothetical protein
MNIEEEKDEIIKKLIQDGKSDQVSTFLEELNVDVPWQYGTDFEFKNRLREQVIGYWNGSKKRPYQGDDRWNNQ